MAGNRESVGFGTEIEMMSDGTEDVSIFSGVASESAGTEMIRTSGELVF